RGAGYPVGAWLRNPAEHGFPSGVKVEPWPQPRAFRERIAELERPIVFHLASAGVTDRNRRTPTVQFEINVRLTADLVKACAEAAVVGLVYAGSCAEYGVIAVGERVTESAPLAATDLY